MKRQISRSLSAFPSTATYIYVVLAYYKKLPLGPEAMLPPSTCIAAISRALLCVWCVREIVCFLVWSERFLCAALCCDCVLCTAVVVAPQRTRIEKQRRPERRTKGCLCSCMFLYIQLFSSCLLYTSPSPRDQRGSRMPSSA